jgi:putative DNA primase/helicase
LRELCGGSGLSLATIETAGIRSETNPKEVVLLLGWRGHVKNVAPAIIFPYTDHTGNLNGYARVKLDTPRIRKKDGKDQPTKYEAPKGMPNRLYIPPQVVPALGDISQALLITEGEKKTLKAVQEGFNCIGLSGVFAWKEKGKEWLLPDFERIQFSGRKVYIAFDSDRGTNPCIQLAERRLARILQKLGAQVAIVELPRGPIGSDGEPQKVGLDDFLLNHSAGDLGVLIESAIPPEDDKPEVKKVDARNLDPMTIARRFAIEQLTHNANGEKTFKLRFWHSEWYLWNPAKRRYVRVSEDMVKAQLRLYLESSAAFVTNTVVSNIMGNLTAVLILNDALEMPSWIDERTGSAATAEFPAAEMLATKSALIHLPSLVAGDMRSVLPTPRFFSGTSLDFDFDPNAAAPVAWNEFLDQLWGDDQQSIECLEEWIGYLLSADTSLQKILVIVGPRRSGKGTIGRILRGLLGGDNMAAPTLAGLGTNFGLWPIYDKSVAVISDARLSGRTDSAMVTERLLSISGEDPQTFDRKNLKPLTMTLPTRFVILTNELPRLGDSSNALVGRFVVLRMTRSFYGQEDHGLTEKLLAERPGILLRGIEGWKRLRDRGRFIQPESAKSLIGDMEALASPVGEFVRDCCIIEPNEEVSRDVLYAAWRKWCERHGKKDTDDGVFGRDLRAAVPSLGDVVHRELGVRHRYYTGIGLRIEDVGNW